MKILKLSALDVARLEVATRMYIRGGYMHDQIKIMEWNRLHVRLVDARESKPEFEYTHGSLVE
jgi:hypothetical protein